MKKLINISKYIVCTMVFASLILLFFNCGVYQSGNIILHKSTGFEMIFGKQQNGISILNFNIFGFIMILTMICSCVVLFLEKQIGKKTHLASLVLILVSTVLYFMLPSTVSHSDMSMAHTFSGLPLTIIGTNVLFVTALFNIFVIVIKSDQEA